MTNASRESIAVRPTRWVSSTVAAERSVPLSTSSASRTRRAARAPIVRGRMRYRAGPPPRVRIYRNVGTVGGRPVPTLHSQQHAILMQADRVAGDHRDGAAINRQEQRPRRMGVGSGKPSRCRFGEHAQLAALRECHLAKIPLQTPRRRPNAAGTPSINFVAIMRPKTFGPTHRPDRQSLRPICHAVSNGCPSRCAGSDSRLTAIESFVFRQFDNLVI
jgi:hypothetical protein